MTRAQQAVAGIAVAAALACVYLIFHAGERIYESIGPSKVVATSDGGLLLVSHGAIHVFDANGKRREIHDLDAIGVTRKPSDLAIHRDGRVVIASPDGSDLMRCDLAKRSCERIDPALTKVEIVQHALPLNSVKVLIDEDRKRYFLSDNAGHKLVETDFSGKHIAETKANAVWYPNQLAFDGPGRLRVADTNHHRIATFDVSGDSFGAVIREFRVDRGVGRAGRVWPFDAVRSPDGRTWVLVADSGMKDADLVIFDSSGTATRRIDLGDDSDPFDVELWRDRIIVADATNYRVDAVDLNGRRVAAFDDADFDAELAKARDAPRMWQTVRLMAQLGIVLVPLIAIFVLKAQGVPMELTARPAAPPPIPGSGAKLGNDVRWIGIRPAFFDETGRKQLRLQLFAIAFAAVALAVWYLVFGKVALGDPGMRGVLVAVTVMVVIQVGSTFLTKGLVRKQLDGYRIGSSVLGLHFELTKGMAPFGMERTGRAPWREVYYDGRMILAGKRSLRLKNQYGIAMFDEAELRNIVIANIPRENLVTPGRMAIIQAGKQPLVIALVVLAIVIYVATSIIRRS